MVVLEVEVVVVVKVVAWANEQVCQKLVLKAVISVGVKTRLIKPEKSYRTFHLRCM